MVRYKLTKDNKYVYLTEDSKDSSTRIETHAVDFQYFVDILWDTKNFHLIRARVFMPKGEIINGFVLRDYVELHNKEELFDGRFNSWGNHESNK
jgi:hypothetical protein